MSGPVVVLVVASGAAWESHALTALNGRRGVVVLKRCVDVDDLLAAASAGQADVAVVGIDAPGLDGTAVEHLRRHGVQPVAVVPGETAGAADAGRLRASRIGIPTVVAEPALDLLPDAVVAVVAAPAPAPATVPRGAPVPPPSTSGQRGRVVVVWGPAGAPGRTTLAAGVAAELGRRARRTVLVDADPYGGTVAQQLGILDEVSGLLSAARLATTGTLAEGFAATQRGLDEHLSVVTGLPRPDRWVEVRPGALGHLLDVAREQGDVVVDTGPGLADDAVEPGRPTRDRLTLEAVEAADELVVVGAADPVGLSRLARGLVDLAEVTGGAPVRVVVNRMRPTLGWSEQEVAGMVAGFGRVDSLHFLPDDRGSVDRALVAGRTLLETGESPLTRAIEAVVDGFAPRRGPVPGSRARGRLSRRTAGRARRR
ncbi:AAA family ATPase [Nocardioides sp. SYSU DS0663]|uniref:AAA family ATPase n=1 Tax=Nocardioides sp. SYSU DS0663 TaxID=3416445 RepID=UPI003F4B0707